MALSWLKVSITVEPGRIEVRTVDKYDSVMKCRGDDDINANDRDRLSENPGNLCEETARKLSCCGTACARRCYSDAAETGGRIL